MKVCWVVCCVKLWLAGHLGASAMEDCAGLLGKIMNSALYWLLHLIDTLLAFVFSITSLISTLVTVDVVAVNVFVKVSTAIPDQ